MGQIVMASHHDLSRLSVGDFVTVDGSVVSAGWLYADRVSMADRPYTPGSDVVTVTGLPSRINYATGRAYLGDLEIDYNAALSSSSVPSGNIWRFRGIQPIDQGLLVSDRIAAQ
jgi:hypothetical protein